MTNLKAVLVLFLLAVFTDASAVYAHISGGSMQTKVASDYQIQFDTSPSPPTSQTTTALFFSVQDLKGSSISNVTVSVSLIKDGIEVRSYPKQLYRYGDFVLNHVFNKDGVHKVGVEIHESQPLKVEFDIMVYDDSLFLFVGSGILIALGTVVAVGFFYIKAKSKKSMLTSWSSP